MARTGWMGGKWLGFGDREQGTDEKRTKREKFSGRHGSGGALADAERPDLYIHYPKASQKVDQPAYSRGSR